MANNYGLGRGLASLIPQKNKKITEPQKDFNYFGTQSDGGSVAPKSGSNQLPAKTNEPESGKNIQEVEIIKIVPNPHQPRTNFNQEKLKELADSIREHGIIQPITVTKNNGSYEIIAGERRFEAAKAAGLKTVPAIVRDASEREKLELAVTENIQRHDLDPIEEAKALKKLIEEFEMSQEEVAQKISKSRSAVANKVRLLNLPVEIQKALIEGKITEGHCKLLLAIPNPEKQRAFFEMIMKNNLTVRQTEDKTREVSVRTHKRTLRIDPEVRRIEDELSQKLGTKVKLTKSGDGGRIVIDYFSEEELRNILDMITKK